MIDKPNSVCKHCLHPIDLIDDLWQSHATCCPYNDGKHEPVAEPAEPSAPIELPGPTGEGSSGHSWVEPSASPQKENLQCAESDVVAESGILSATGRKDVEVATVTFNPVSASSAGGPELECGSTINTLHKYEKNSAAQPVDIALFWHELSVLLEKHKASQLYQPLVVAICRQFFPASTPERVPDGYAYRYRHFDGGTVIRFEQKAREESRTEAAPEAGKVPQDMDWPQLISQNILDDAFKPTADGYRLNFTVMKAIVEKWLPQYAEAYALAHTSELRAERDAAMMLSVTVPPEILTEMVTPPVCGVSKTSSGLGLAAQTMGGCGQSIKDPRECYRCADCSVPFHKQCLQKHCKSELRAAEAENATLRSALQSCFKVICGRCNSGIPLERNQHHLPNGLYRTCKASAIRDAAVLAPPQELHAALGSVTANELIAKYGQPKKVTTYYLGSMECTPEEYAAALAPPQAVAPHIQEEGK